MAPGNPQPPPPTNHPYNPLPSTPHQPQYYVVLPFYSSSNHRTFRHLCRRYLTCATTVFLLSLALYFLYPSDPYLKVVNLRLDRFKIHANPKISLDIVLGVRIKIRNPDVYSLNYKSLNVSVEYRGEELGFVTSDDGNVKALGTSFIDATLVLNGAQVLNEAVFLIEDLVRGSIPFTTTSQIRGSLGVVLFNLPISAKLTCEVVMNTHNQTIERQDCYPAGTPISKFTVELMLVLFVISEALWMGTGKDYQGGKNTNLYAMVFGKCFLISLTVFFFFRVIIVLKLFCKKPQSLNVNITPYTLILTVIIYLDA